LERLNVEVRRLQTYMRDEEYFLSHHLGKLQEDDPKLALQLQYKLLHLQAFNKVHRARIRQIHALYSFSGVRICGIRKGHMDDTIERQVSEEWEIDNLSDIDSEPEEVHDLLDAVNTGLDNMTLD